MSAHLFAQHTPADPSPHPPLQAIRLREVAPAQTQLARRLGPGLRATLQLDDATSVQLEASHLRSARPGADRRSLLLHTPAGVLALTPARDLLRVLTAIDVPDPATQGTTPAPSLGGHHRVHQLHLDMATQAMPPAWLALFGASAFLMGNSNELALDPADEPALLELSLTLVHPQARLGMTAALRGSGQALLHALSQPGWERDGDEGASLADNDLPVRVPVALGSTELPLQVVHDLAAGDIVPVHQPCFDLSGQGELRIGQGLAKCVLQPGNHPGIEITEWHPMAAAQRMNPTKDPLSVHPHGEFDTPLDAVAMTLTFELGVLELALSELRQLAPGSVLPIHGGMPPQVAICAGGQRIGVGDLVDLGGQPAVQIRRIGARS